MTVFYRVCIGSLFLLWLILTVVNQFDNPWAVLLRRYDVFHLLPRWTFFAPNPGTSDYHLVYRYLDTDGAVSEFKEMTLPGRKSIISALWNPHKRVRKAFLDLAIDLSRLCGSPEIDEHNIQLTFSYVAILNFLNGVPVLPGACRIQYALMRSEGFIDAEEPKLVLSSEFHDI